MDSHPVISQHMKPKLTRTISGAPKINLKTGPPLLREKRVFGTVRNPNIPSKTAPKPSSGLVKGASKPSQPSPVAEAKTSSEKNPTRPKKKSACSGKILVDGNVVEPGTPVEAKPSRSATPFHSAERCSKCRFDRLETAAYWLSQIKLAQSVGKHSVSAAFFRLAFHSKAEPVRNIRVELKKYLGRHDYLNGEQEWKNLSVRYELLKEESIVNTAGLIKMLQVFTINKTRDW